MPQTNPTDPKDPDLPQASNSEDSDLIPATAPRRGRTRDEHSRDSIHAATRRLARTSGRYRDVSIEKIASEANASKATIYRWWDCKGDLIREACMLDQIAPPRGVSLHKDLKHLISQLGQVYSEAATAPVIAGAWAELVENRVNQPKETPEFLCPHFEQISAMLAEVFSNARVRGDWQGPFDAEAAYDALNGQILYRIIGRGHRFDEADVARLVEHALLAARP